MVNCIITHEDDSQYKRNVSLTDEQVRLLNFLTDEDLLVKEATFTFVEGEFELI